MPASGHIAAIQATAKSSTRKAVAPAWHTILMIMLVLGPLIQAKLVDMSRPGAALRSPPPLQLYIVGAMVECIFFLFAWWGLRLQGLSLRILIGVHWSSGQELGRDIGLAFVFWSVWYGVLTLLKIGLSAARISNTHALGMVYPSGVLQVALWIPNALLAGIAEETVFRGYLMKQFTAWTRRAPVGLVLQALLFGMCHGYSLGLRQMLLISASGVLIGAFVFWRGSLFSAVVFHSWADLFGAVIVRGLPFQ